MCELSFSASCDSSLASRLTTAIQLNDARSLKAEDDMRRMKRTTRRVGALALLGSLPAIGVSTAQAGPVNFERQTHFRCYTVSTQTP
jgi:hypothetical protein